MQLLFLLLNYGLQVDYKAALGKITSAGLPVSVSHEANEYMVKIGKAALIGNRKRKRPDFSGLFLMRVINQLV